ncbi:MAG: M20/M25/M40 family metallo-hydrolase [Candidatus Aminicenantes bacterium]|nr:M20/M25/M40 family metallo-hydrolase [Candidatus Aminicenantes bacterium]
MKTLRTLLAVLLAAGLVLAAPGALPRQRPGGPVALVKIPKGPGYSPALVARLGVDVRQELRTSLLALADATDQARLRRSGVRFSVLDRTAGRRELFVVGAGSPADLAALRAAGRAVAVEPGTAIFWTETGSAAEAVPAGLPRKALSARTVRPARPAAAPTGPAPAAPPADPFIETLAGQVTASSLNATVQTLQDFQTRYASTSNCEAAGEALYAAFSALGLDDVAFQTFTFAGSYTSRNVVAEKTGSTFPDDIYIVCAHYDSTSPSATRLTHAPGADDNASGTAAVLEAARVLAPHELDYTVRFIAFSAEEWGLYGSRAYAAAARTAGERVRGVINLDMIAYADAMPEDLQIIVNPASEWLADLYLGAAASYGPLAATKTVDASFVYSDHSPFWDTNYPALLAIEDDPLTNPYYHKTTDTLSTLQPDFFTASARASLGLLAELAQPVKAGYPGTPTGLLAMWEVYYSMFRSLATVHLTWRDQADAAGYNVYRSSTPHLGYVKLNAAPIEGRTFTDDTVVAEGTYYYVVTAVGPTGLESNRSAEIVPADFFIDDAPRPEAP